MAGEWAPPQPDPQTHLADPTGSYGDLRGRGDQRPPRENAG